MVLRYERTRVNYIHEMIVPGDRGKSGECAHRICTVLAAKISLDFPPSALYSSTVHAIENMPKREENEMK